jgi:hypothetical protein
MARWQNGHAAACKAAYAGSIPTLASIRCFCDLSDRGNHDAVIDDRTLHPEQARVAKSVDAADLKSAEP